MRYDGRRVVGVVRGVMCIHVFVMCIHVFEKICKSTKKNRTRANVPRALASFPAGQATQGGRMCDARRGLARRVAGRASTRRGGARDGQKESARRAKKERRNVPFEKSLYLCRCNVVPSIRMESVIVSTEADVVAAGNCGNVV